MAPPDKTSLVVTTYNWKEALDLTFRSIERQVEMPDEVVVADDGSREDTAMLVQSWASRLPVPVLHVWQEDLCSHVSRARNRAVAASSGDYVVIVDGDLILHRCFVADHKRAARPGAFVQGVRLLTEPNAAERILREGTLDLGFFSRHVRRRRHTVRNRLLSRLIFLRRHTDLRGIRGCNQGYWRKDLIRVNGFDEDMTGSGGEDSELAARMYNAGIVRRDLKFAALTIHIHHPSRRTPGENPNNRFLRATTARRSIRCERGLSLHLPPSPESRAR